MPDFSGWSPWINAGIFLAAAAVVWWAGTRLTRYADAISEMTGLGQAVVGMLLLGGITSLPEIAVSVSAGLTGSADLAVSNILGGVALQVVIIAIGDALLRDRTISSQVPRPTVLLQAIFSCLLLATVIAGILIGDVAVLGVGLWSTAIVLGGIAMFWLVSRYRKNETWKADPQPHLDQGEQEGKPDGLRRAMLLTCGMGGVILVAGYLLAKTGEAIANQTGLGEGFVGATLVGAGTSLPEISTVIAAVRLRRYTMAFADIFGTNMFDVMLVFLIDAVYSGPPVLNGQDSFAAVGALLGIVVTLLYVAGLVERRDKPRLRLGLDSWAVIAVYLGGVVALYFLS